MPYAGYNQPILELPQNRALRITLSVNAWLGEPIINSASKLTIFMALESLALTVSSKCKTIPKWIPEDRLQRYIAEYGADKPGDIAAAYVKQKCLELMEYLNAKSFFENEGLDVLVCGDGYVNIVSNAFPAEEQEIYNAPDGPATVKAVDQLKAKMIQDGRGDYNIYALQSLNPSAVWLYPDFAGRITHGKVVHLLGEGVWDLNLDNLIHLKPFTWNWVVYGVPHYISALKWVDIKFKFMDALYTNAARYVTPREWLKIKGPIAPENQAALPPTDAQMDWAVDIMANCNSGVPFVMPDGWDWNYLGAEGKVLRTEMLMEKIDDAIRTAAQVSRTFTSGAANVPAYATSKLQAGVMYKAIQPLKDMIARAIEGRILARFCIMNGFFEEDGTLVAPKVEFKTMPIQGDDSIEKKLQTLLQYNLLSPTTAWELEGIDPALEQERMARAAAGNMEPHRAISPDLSPSQTPDRFDELREEIEERLYLMNLSRAQGYKKLIGQVGRVLYDQKIGDWKDADLAAEDIAKYLVQASYLYRAGAKERLDTAIPWEEQVYRKKEAEDALAHPDEGPVARAAVVLNEEKNPNCKAGNGRML
jgi:hypothetical protein